MSEIRLRTQRLELIAGTPQITRAEMRDRAEFASLLGVLFPEDWPPPLNDEATIARMARFMEENPDLNGFGVWYFALPEAEGLRLIGNGGFKGRPTEDGTVEIGYSLLEPYQGRGYGTEIVAALVEWVFSHPEVRRVIAETMLELKPSIRVLEKNGFRHLGEGSEPGVIRLEKARPARP